VTVQVELNVGDAGAPARVELQGAPALSDGGCDPSAADVGVLSADVSGFLWSGTYSWSGSDATLQLCSTAFSASDAGLASAQLEVKVDTTPPTIGIAQARAPADSSDPAAAFQPAFARDEAPLGITVTDSDGTAGSGITSVSVNVLGADGGVLQTLTGPGYSVNLQTLPLQEHGVFTVVATATDAVGNVSTIASTSFAVTRWKWVADTAASVPTTVSMPAVDSAGNTYVTELNGVYAFNSSGVLIWRATVPSVTSLAPAMANDGGVLFIAQNDGTISLLNAVDGSDAGSYGTTDTTLLSMAVGARAFDGGSIDTVFASAHAGNLYGMQADGTAFAVPLTPGGNLGGAYTDGATAYFARKNGTSYSLADGLASYLGPAFSTSNPIAALNEDPLGGQTSKVFGPVATAQESFFVGGAGGLDLGHIDLTADQETPAAAPMGDVATAELVLGNPGTVYEALSGSNIVLVQDVGNALLSASAPYDGTNGLLLGRLDLYGTGSTQVSAVSREVFPDAGWGSLDWQINLPSATGAPANSPNVVCSTQHTALLLVPTNKGRIIALVIDDPGLDATAGWPKARRDPMNRANIADTLQSCP
jgi:hypothetical protein